MTYQLHVGRCEDVLKTLPDNSVDAIVTDPPYGLSFMNHKWDYDVPTVEQWQECLRVLKPGGHLLAFGGSRTYHRLVVNAEDAGFEIRAGAGRTSGAKNNHPTVKPIALMSYLCRLITPPGGTVLDPWMGSGSTGRAAVEEGFNFIGIDLNPDYVTIASARIAHSFKKTTEAA